LSNIPIKNNIKIKSNVLGKRDLHRFQLEGMILGNRGIISQFRLRGID